MSETTNYVTGRKALSDPMVALLEYLAAKENSVRYLKGVNLTYQYTWFKENRIVARTWKALEDRGLIEGDTAIQRAVVTAEGYRALFQLAIPADLHQAIVDNAHADAVIEDLERTVARIGANAAERASHDLGPILDLEDEDDPMSPARIAEEEAKRAAEDCGCGHDDAPSPADTVPYKVDGDPEFYEPCGCLKNSAGAHRGDCPGVKDWADAADALLDERMTEEIPAWGDEPEHAVQAVWYHRNIFGMSPTGAQLPRIEKHALERATELGWLISSHPGDKGTQYRVADRVRNLAVLRAAVRHRSYPVAPLDSRVLAQPADQGGGVTRLTIGTDALGDWYLVGERVSPVTFEINQRSLVKHPSRFDAQADLASRTSSLLGWGWSQAFRFTGDGVTPVR